MSLSMKFLELLELLLQLLEPPARVPKPSFGCQALVVGQVLRRAGDQRVEVGRGVGGFRGGGRRGGGPRGRGGSVGWGPPRPRRTGRPSPPRTWGRRQDDPATRAPPGAAPASG